MNRSNQNTDLASLVAAAQARRAAELFILDAEVLLARIDSAHVAHSTVYRWSAERSGVLPSYGASLYSELLPPIGTRRQARFLLTPSLEREFIALYGSTAYPGGPRNAVGAFRMLNDLIARRLIDLVPEDISVADKRVFVDRDPFTKIDPTLATRLYALGVAKANDAVFVTLRSEVGSVADAVADGPAHLIILNSW